MPGVSGVPGQALVNGVIGCAGDEMSPACDFCSEPLDHRPGGGVTGPKIGGLAGAGDAGEIAGLAFIVCGETGLSDDLAMD